MEKTETHLKTVVEALSEKMGEDTVVLDLRGLTQIADYFIISTGNSVPHIRALSDSVESKLRENKIKPLHIEGQRNNSWIILDYGDILVHIFNPEARAYYELERFWLDAHRVSFNNTSQPNTASLN
ncbi:ribosome silencing factor [Candidatus Magnetomonas plexicatena]|uniref:ribosome silencing factor n=1 Tax=Candidatus Magnetomonas plexicatena TaxID=2552947 RepID=UPI001102E999|nr:ribosome silencing factor [Nitrospirales bacterium LBB_01]